MALELHPDSHIDHGLTTEQRDYLVSRFADREAFFIETIELPEKLGMTRCDLVGPVVGDPPVPEDRVIYEKRGEREWSSRMIVVSQPRMTRAVTVIAGPHDGRPCVLFTAYGGPPAPQEPDDPRCRDADGARAFWKDHALAKVVPS